MLPLSQAMQWRYATQQFDDRTVDHALLSEVLDITRLSASSYGLQPYRLIVVNDKPIRQRLREYSFGQSQVTQASTLVVFAAVTGEPEAVVAPFLNAQLQTQTNMVEAAQKTERYLTSKLVNMTPQNRKEWAVRQTYIALGTFLVAAASLQLDTCPMEGIEPAQYDKILGLTGQGLSTTVVCPVGYRRDDDNKQFMPKVRLPYQQMVRYYE